MEIYVISNSDLFREGLNAIATFCKSSSFKTGTYLGSAIGILMTGIAYTRQHDILVFLRWYAMYFFVFHILLGAPQTVVIINASDNSVPGYFVDNVPIGIALPAHLITTFGEAWSQELDQVFAMPNSFQYHQTGMLFGSNLFRLSLALKLEDPNVMDEMNSYVRSCVIGDILINKKYTFNDLLKSEDVWSLMSSRPSPIRGIFVDDSFMNCIQASHDLTKKINYYAGNVAPTILGRLIPSHRVYANAAINGMVESSYQTLTGRASSANSILRQNIVINAFRSGIQNYAAETGSLASLQNFSDSLAMMNTRMAWSTSSHIGVQTLPLMQVVLLLLMLCLFPLIAVLTLVPGLGISVFKNYIYTLIWLESWPIMFSILNLAMTFYAEPGSGQTVSVTLSNINLLAQEHSDIAGIAGYLILAIPFLSIGIVKGMASTFNQASQYLGGMIHNIGQSAASTVATGNYSLGNVSTANATANSLNANKHDTNYTDMHGLESNQLANATTLTSTPSGSMVSNVSGGISNLATNVNAAHSLSLSLSNSADSYKSLAESHRKSAEDSISNAISNALSHDKNQSEGSSVSKTSTETETSQADKALSRMHNIAQEVAKRNGISVEEALSIGIGAKLPLAKFGNFGADVNGSLTFNGKHHSDDSKSFTDRESKDFRSAMSILENYSTSVSGIHSNSTSDSLAERVGADLRKAESFVESSSSEYSKADRLSKQASLVSSDSSSIQSNFNQGFAEFVRKTNPDNANFILNNTNSNSASILRNELAEQYLHQFTKGYENQFLNSSPTIGHHDSGSTNANKSEEIKKNYEESSSDMKNSFINIDTQTQVGIINSEVLRQRNKTSSNLNNEST